MFPILILTWTISTRKKTGSMFGALALPEQGNLIGQQWDIRTPSLVLIGRWKRESVDSAQFKSCQSQQSQVLPCTWSPTHSVSMKRRRDTRLPICNTDPDGVHLKSKLRQRAPFLSHNHSGIETECEFSAPLEF